MTRRESILAALTLVALLLATAWSYSVFAEQREAALSAEASTANCQSLAASIRSQSPGTSPSSSILQPSAFTASLSQAATDAKLAPDAISQIDPQPVRQSEGSALEQHPVRLTLQNVTLRQLGTFLHALPCPAEELHLSTTSDTSSTWSADMTITYTTRATNP